MNLFFLPSYQIDQDMCFRFHWLQHGSLLSRGSDVQKFCFERSGVLDSSTGTFIRSSTFVFSAFYLTIAFVGMLALLAAEFVPRIMSASVLDFNYALRIFFITQFVLHVVLGMFFLVSGVAVLVRSQRARSLKVKKLLAKRNICFFQP